METRDDIEEAVHGLEIFSKNYCINVKETEKQKKMIYRCDGCIFEKTNRTCLIKEFACNNNHVIV